jgi:hypothetical protein
MLYLLLYVLLDVGRLHCQALPQVIKDFLFVGKADILILQCSE